MSESLEFDTVILQNEGMDAAYIEVPFEDRKFYVMEGYDFYLRNIYGDYMELPPIEDRVSHHVFKAWRKD